MFASAIAIIKWVLVLISGGALYQGFANNNGNNNNTLAAKIAGAIVTMITMVAFASDASGLFSSNAPTESEAIKTEQIFWESVEKHPSEKLYRDYLKSYPEGKFKDIALAQLAALAPPAPVAQAVNPVPAQSAPVAQVEQQAASTPTPSEPLQTTQVAELPVSAAKPAEDLQTIDRYQVKGGLVRDTKTGLMWMRCSIGQTWNGTICEGDASFFGSWKDAKKRAEDVVIEGYDDWRLPTIEELITLVYCSSGLPITWNDTQGNSNMCQYNDEKPTIMSNVFPNTPTTVVWSSTSRKNSYGYTDVGIVNFANGYSLFGADSGGAPGNLIRLVRSEK